jgi:Tfp pilus assembly protein PilF
MILSKAVGSSLLLIGLCLAALPGVAQTPYGQAVREARDDLNREVELLTEPNHDEAAQFFEKAVQLDPDFEAARLYLALAYQSQFVPGSTDPRSEEMAQKSIAGWYYRLKKPLESGDRSAE